MYIEIPVECVDSSRYVLKGDDEPLYIYLNITLIFYILYNSVCHIYQSCSVQFYRNAHHIRTHLSHYPIRIRACIPSHATMYLKITICHQRLFLDAKPVRWPQFIVSLTRRWIILLILFNCTPLNMQKMHRAHCTVLSIRHHFEAFNNRLNS